MRRRCAGYGFAGKLLRPCSALLWVSLLLEHSVSSYLIYRLCARLTEDAFALRQWGEGMGRDSKTLVEDLALALQQRCLLHDIMSRKAATPMETLSTDRHLIQGK